MNNSIQTITHYRIYADGTVVHEDDFDSLDNQQIGYMDDYQEVAVPEEVVEFIADWDK